MFSKLSDKELKTALDSMIILTDSREQKNEHILSYFDKKKIAHTKTKLEQGDYSCILPAAALPGAANDMYFNVMVERKANLNELAGNFVERTRIENEFMRAKFAGVHMTLLVEDARGYENIIMGNYKSEYKPQSFLGTLKAFEHRYGFSTSFVDPKMSGNFIYYHLLYFVREQLKRGLAV